jgi:SAM-dependent methyltransferase
LSEDEHLCGLINPYAGSSPSVIRQALASLPPVDDYSFVDLGCGKGRAMIVASELDFGRILGVEISPDLAAIARRNAAAIARRFPERPEMTVVEGNAVEFALPEGDIVLFIYHAFGQELMQQLTRALEMRVQRYQGHLFVVYYNPVHFEFFDGSREFELWYAATIESDASEVGYAPDDKDTVVIWQNTHQRISPVYADRDRRIVILQELWRAGLS